MWNWISILDVKIFILFNSLLLGGKVSEWKVQKLTLHIVQMFNKFDNFFLLWHFYYTCILDCFIYFYFFLQSHLSNQWMAASSRFLGFRRRSQFALWLGSCSRSRGKNLLCQVSAFFHIIIRWYCPQQLITYHSIQWLYWPPLGLGQTQIFSTLINKSSQKNVELWTKCIGENIS